MNRGFTLLEAMIAVAILALSIGGPLYGTSRTLVAANIAQDRLTATYLAQEGVEYIRLYRDRYYLNNYPNTPDLAWGQFTSDGTLGSCRHPSVCTIDTVTGNIAAYNAANPLYRDASGRYTQNPSGTPTPFARQVQIISEPGNEEVSVVSTVSWLYKGRPYSVAIREQLTSWQ